MAKSEVRRAILVLGMHRSGTSVFAGTLARAGVRAPANMLMGNFGNPKGHYESVPILRLHEELLLSAGSSWRDWRQFPPAWNRTRVANQFRRRAIELIGEEFGDSPLFVLKDPRLCRIVPFWRAVLDEARIAFHAAIPLRAPLEVARSLGARDSMSVQEGLLLWLRHVLDAERTTRGLPRAVVPMEALLSDWRLCLTTLSEDLNIPFPTSRESDREIEEFISNELKHHNVGPIGTGHEWADEAYEALLDLALEPSSRPAQRKLDRISIEFDRACNLFGSAQTIQRAVDVDPGESTPQPGAYVADSVDSNMTQPLGSPHRCGDLMAADEDLARLRKMLVKLRVGLETT